MTLAATACGPLIVALPPPASLAVDGLQVDAAALRTSAGASIAWPGEVTANQAGGTAGLRLGYGLTRHIDLTLLGSFVGLGNGGAIQLGWRPIRSSSAELGLIAGLAGHYVSGVFNNSPCGDEPGCTSSILDYSYLSLAPHAGLRGAWHLHDRLAVTGLARASYAFTLTLSGLDSTYNRRVFWLEPMIGLVFSPVDRLRLGLAAGGYVVDFTGLVPTASLSVSYDLLAPKR